MKATKNLAERVLLRQRIDKWLWHARMVRTRTAAADLATAGHVRINGRRIEAPAHAVKAGDVVTLALDRSVKVVRIAGLAERRTSAADARALYERLDGGPLPGLDASARPRE